MCTTVIVARPCTARRTPRRAGTPLPGHSQGAARVKPTPPMHTLPRSPAPPPPCSRASGNASGQRSRRAADDNPPTMTSVQGSRRSCPRHVLPSQRRTARSHQPTDNQLYLLALASTVRIPLHGAPTRAALVQALTAPPRWQPAAPRSLIQCELVAGAALPHRRPHDRRHASIVPLGLALLAPRHEDRTSESG